MKKCDCKAKLELYKMAFELAVECHDCREYFLERAEEEFLTALREMLAEG